MFSPVIYILIYMYISLIVNNTNDVCWFVSEPDLPLSLRCCLKTVKNTSVSLSVVGSLVPTAFQRSVEHFPNPRSETGVPRTSNIFSDSGSGDPRGLRSSW